jgi:hypothetical protein
VTTPAEETLASLKRVQHEVAAANGMWNATALRYWTDEGMRPGWVTGSPLDLRQLADDHRSVERRLDEALAVLGEVRDRHLPTIWTGDTQVSARAALAAAERALHRAVVVAGRMARALDEHAVVVDAGDKRDRPAHSALARAHELVGQITLGPIPDPGSYDGAVMYRAHHLAMDAMAERVGAHTGVVEAARRLDALLYDLAGQARLHRLAGSPLSPVDELLLADAGATDDSSDTAILTASVAQRAAARFDALGEDERVRMRTLLSDAQGPEHRAYLMRALAAGYSVAELIRFDSRIRPYAADPRWLRAHLSPLDAGQVSVSGTPDATEFDGHRWTQGDRPTCVAASTVIARAQVDPLYALRLTTGEHPGDPADDAGSAFAQRLRDEQQRVYDAGRPWYMELPVVGEWTQGMTDGQSEAAADAEVGTRTGADYQDRDTDGADGRRAVLPDIERAVDAGDVVPFSTREGDTGHQMLVIGHEGDMLQVYNPWGYTVWVREDDFVAGRMDVVDADVPAEPVSVRLPRR